MDFTQVKQGLEANGFAVSCFDTKEQAVHYLAQCTAGKTVAFGGSQTLEAMHAYETLAEQAEVHWHWKGDGFKQDAEVYCTSANAVSETGELVNIDGACNRVAGMLYGAKQAFVVCGRNKIAPNLHAALDRAQNVAAPKNAMRFGKNTPCVANGGDQCYHCKSPERICRAIVILQGPPLAMEQYEVILVDEDLGF